MPSPSSWPLSFCLGSSSTLWVSWAQFSLPKVLGVLLILVGGVLVVRF